MALIEWSDNYSVGIEKFDRQHKGLVELINELNEAMKRGQGKLAVEEIVRKLAGYTVEHFKAEEELFAKYNFPGAREHIEEHKRFTADVEQFQKDLESEKLFLSIEIMNFLKDWLIKHILDADKNYSDFLKAKGVS